MRHLVTLLLFAGAIVAYLAGSMPGAGALVIVGIALEAMAWYRVIRGRKQRPVSTQ